MTDAMHASVSLHARTVHIRPMEPRDAEAAAHLCAELGYQRNTSDVCAWIATIGSNKEGQAAFVACKDNEVIGWVEVSMERRLQSPPFALIGGLIVKDGARGQGIGRLLCKQAEEWAGNMARTRFVSLPAVRASTHTVSICRAVFRKPSCRGSSKNVM